MATPTNLLKAPRAAWKAAVSLLRAVYLHRNARVSWATPARSRLVVFDAAGSSILKEILGTHKYELVYTRGERVCLAPRVIFRTIGNLYRAKHPLAAYFLALVQEMRPALVVTYVDNNGIYGVVARNYPLARFLAVQNGIRCLGRDNPPGTRPIFHDQFSCFGQHEVDMYTKNGAQVRRFLPFGSLRDSLYRVRRKDRVEEKQYEICLVSEAEESLAKLYPEIDQATGRLAEFVARFSERHNVRVCIASRNDPEEDPAAFAFEALWYRRRMGDAARLIPNKRADYTSYRLIDASDVSISFCSTALLEALGRGKRVLFCNLSSLDWYDVPMTGVWFLKRPSYEQFEQRLIELLAMSDRDFQRQAASAAAYLMSHDEKMPTHAMLRQLVDETLAT